MTCSPSRDTTLEPAPEQLGPPYSTQTKLLIIFTLEQTRRQVDPQPIEFDDYCFGTKLADYLEKHISVGAIADPIHSNVVTYPHVIRSIQEASRRDGRFLPSNRDGERRRHLQCR